MRQKCVNRFCDIHVKTLLAKVQDMDVVTILQTMKYLSGKFPECPKTFYTVRKFSTLSSKFPDYLETFSDQLETFQTVWKLSRLSRKFSRLSGNFQTVCKLSRLFRNFPDCSKTVLKLSGHSGNFPYLFTLQFS